MSLDFRLGEDHAQIRAMEPEQREREFAAQAAR